MLNTNIAASGARSSSAASESDMNRQQQSVSLLHYSLGLWCRRNHHQQQQQVAWLDCWCDTGSKKL